MSAGTMVQEASTTWKDAHADQEGDVVPDQDRETVDEGDDASVSNSDDESDGGEYYNPESNRLEQIDSEDEFVDVEFEELVSSEGPKEMLRLMLQEQADGIMTKEIADGMIMPTGSSGCSDAEKGILSVHESTHNVHVPLLL
jgi:hypothetical protein